MPITLISHQVKPSKAITDFILGIGEYSDSNYNGCLVIGNTGCGKTFVLAAALKAAQEAGKLLIDKEKTPFKNYSIFFLTPKKCITQQKRVLYRAGVEHFEVASHSSLASTYGSLFIDWKSTTRRGVLDTEAFWDEDSKPDVIVVDECQFVKNTKAARSKAIQAAIRQGIKIIFVSATPFQKPGESEIIVTACKITTPEDFDYYMMRVSPMGPMANSKAAIRRIKNDLIDHKALISIKGVRYPFKPIVRNILINLTPEQRVIYNQTIERYHEVLRKEGRRGPTGVVKIWVEQNKYRETTDILKADALASRAYQVANYVEQPRQIIIASNFVAALEKIWHNLVKVHHVPKDLISVLYGGQSEKESQLNIDRFQEGKTWYFLTTMKSGGTGLSLHHEMPSAYPRYVLLPPTWSIYEYCQVLGRAQRITSLSQTIQEVVWFRGTIEEHVAHTLDEKCESIGELLDKGENFIHRIFHKEVENDIDNSVYDEEISKQENESSTNEDDESEGIDKGMFADADKEKEFGDE